MIDDALIPDSAVAAVVRALDLAGVVAISSRNLSPVPLASTIDRPRRMELGAHGIWNGRRDGPEGDCGEAMNATEIVADYEVLTAEALVEQIVREAAGAPVCLTNGEPRPEHMVVLHAAAATCAGCAGDLS